MSDFHISESERRESEVGQQSRQQQLAHINHPGKTITMARVPAP